MANNLLLEKALNALGFQVGWWCCVLGAAHGMGWLGPVVMIMYIIHQALSRTISRRQWTIVAGTVVCGTMLDSLMSLTGLVRYEGGFQFAGWLAPLWITALWAGFALTVDSSLGFLRGRIWLSALLGATGGPLSYLAAVRLGAASFGYAITATLVILSFTWASVIAALFHLADVSRLTHCENVQASSKSLECAGGGP